MLLVKSERNRRKLMKKDRRFIWRTGHPSDLFIHCPDCKRPARVLNAGVGSHNRTLKVEAICYDCDHYFYVSIQVPGNALLETCTFGQLA